MIAGSIEAADGAGDALALVLNGRLGQIVSVPVSKLSGPTLSGTLQSTHCVSVIAFKF
jgi:hypothetical protein